MSLIGLDYPAVFAVAALHNIIIDADLFAGLQTLEADTLSEIAERQERDHGHEQESQRHNQRDR